MRKQLIGLGVTAFILGGVVNVNATAIGSGDLEVSAGISYTTDSLNMNYGLETWIVGGIFNPGWVANASNAEYGDENIAGWDKTPDDISLSYLDAKVDITNDHTTPLNPTSKSSVYISTTGTPGVQIQTSASSMSFADFTATTDGTLSFWVDYDGFWEGSTTSIGDYVQLYTSLQARITQKIFNADGSYSWSSNLASFYEYESVWFDDGDLGSIDNFNGRLSLSYDFVAGGVYQLRFDAANNVKGYSNDLSEPVPEPATMLLFGTGLVGLAGSRLRKKRK